MTDVALWLFMMGAELDGKNSGEQGSIDCCWLEKKRQRHVWTWCVSPCLQDAAGISQLAFLSLSSCSTQCHYLFFILLFFLLPVYAQNNQSMRKACSSRFIMGLFQFFSPLNLCHTLLPTHARAFYLGADRACFSGGEDGKKVREEDERTESRRESGVKQTWRNNVEDINEATVTLRWLLPHFPLILTFFSLLCRLSSKCPILPSSPFFHSLCS